MMEEYIATFYSHFDAMAFKKKCEARGFPARVMPVPRALSSSCGTCVRFSGDVEEVRKWTDEEVEQIVRCLEQGKYQVLWQAET